MKLNRFRLLLVSSIAFVACQVSTPRLGSLQTRNETVDGADARSVRVDLKMGVGKLRVESGASYLLEAQFTYNVAELKPEVAYRVRNGRGELTVQQPSRVVARALPQNVRYEWDLRLGQAVPMDLTVMMGAGTSDLRLPGVPLKSLNVKSGVGGAKIDLTGNWHNDVSVTVQGGVGSLTMRLPSRVGVRVKVTGGLGALRTQDLRSDGGYYVNDAYGRSPVNIHISIAGGVGSINLEVGEPENDTVL